MSPRRMDISSLLRDPSPDDDPLITRPRPPDHPPPASLLSILNSPTPTPPHYQPSFHPTPPFLGLDALVHVASEERRRITAVTPPSLPERDLLPLHRDRTHPSLVYDHVRPSRHYSYPLPSHAQPHSPFLGSPRSKRPRDSHSPSPEPSLSNPSTSPSTRLHSSASPVSIYPTLRRQPLLHMDPTRSAPAFLASPADDSRAIPYPSPFLLSPHPSPPNSSPRRHSPQQFRSQLHSSPIHSTSRIPPSAESDPVSPRYSHGPRMAGGIEILSNDSFSIRDPPRPDLSNFHSPRRDVSTERLVSEARAEHAPLKLFPLPGRVFSPDDDRLLRSHHMETRETESHRERIRSGPVHLPSHLVGATLDIGRNMNVPPNFHAQPPLERHPIRVWEEQPTRVLPVHMLSRLCNPAQGRTWSGTSEGTHSAPPVTEESPQDVTKNVPTLPFDTCEELPLSRPPTPKHGLTSPPAPIEKARHDSQLPVPAPMQLPSPELLISHARLPRGSHLDPRTPRIPASPIHDLPVKTFDTQFKPETESPEAQEGENTSTSLTPSTPNVTEPIAEPIPRAADADDILVANPLTHELSPGPAQPSLAEDSGPPTHPTQGTVSHNTSRGSSQPPLLIPAKEGHDVPAENIPILPESTHRSPEPEITSEREPPALEQAMMDVDEELLSLVEDRPTRVTPTVPKVHTGSTLPLRIAGGRGTSAGAEQGSSAPPDGLSLVLSSQPDIKGTLLTDEEKDRASMPPPVVRNKKAEKDKTTGSRKKKDGASKPAAKTKQPSKPRARPVPKAKAKINVADASSKGSIPKCAVNVNERSRSTSVMPAVVDDAVPEPDADDSDKEDDKLYCVCKTRYDEDRMMIACDRCDEWFHTLCVEMPDLEIDLVDQFICPPCLQKHSQLRTTWKRRCLFGLQHENPLLPEACHKPSRGALSKFCSDECGIKNMGARIEQWEKSGGARDLLWEGVKNAGRREGVVVCAEMNGTKHSRMMDVDGNNSEPKPLDSAAKKRADREVARLNARLEEVVREREYMKRELDMVMWREKVVVLASKRAAKVDECGWDQRLCFGEEEWRDFGPEVLESYDEERVKVESSDGAVPFDAADATHGEWWCGGQKKCERHGGWQKLRTAEVSFDKETKEGILLKLTTREREIRKRIEDILYPQPSGTLQAPFKPAHPEIQINGPERPPSMGDVSERRGEGHRSYV